MSADTADKILSSDWLVSLKLCSDCLGEPFTDEFQKWRQTQQALRSKFLVTAKGWYLQAF